MGKAGRFTAKAAVLMAILVQTLTSPPPLSHRPKFIQQDKTIHSDPYQGDLPTNADHTVFFTQIGRVTTSLGYVNAVLTIDLHTLQQTIDSTIAKGIAIVDTLVNGDKTDKSTREMYMEAAKHNVTTAKNVLRALTGSGMRIPDGRTAQTLSAIKDAILPLVLARQQVLLAGRAAGATWEGTPRGGTSSTREERQAFEILAAIAGTALGAYSLFQLQEIKSQLEEDRATMAIKLQSVEERLTAELDHHWERMDGLERSITTIKEIIWVERAFDNLAIWAQKIANTIQAAVKSEFAPDIMSDNQVEELFQEVKTEASKFNFQPLIQSSAQMFQCKTSFLTTTEDITLFIHVPVHQDQPLTLFQYTPLPFKRADIYITLESKDDILAIDDSQDSEVTFRSFNAQTLAGCSRNHDLYLCENSNVAKIQEPQPHEPKESENCLYSLFTRNWERAVEACNVIYRPLTDKAIQVAPNTFVTYNKIHKQGRIRCAPGVTSQHSDFQQGERQAIYVPPGCIAKTSSHKMTGAISINLPSHQVKAYGIPEQAEETLDQTNSTIQLMQAAKAMGTSPQHLREFRKQVADYVKKREEEALLHIPHHINHVATATLVLLLVVAVVGGAILAYQLRKCKARQQQQTDKIFGNGSLERRIGDAMDQYIQNRDPTAMAILIRTMKQPEPQPSRPLSWFWPTPSSSSEERQEAEVQYRPPAYGERVEIIKNNRRQQ